VRTLTAGSSIGPSGKAQSVREKGSPRLLGTADWFGNNQTEGGARVADRSGCFSM